MDDSVSREEYLQKMLVEYGWTSWNPGFPEIYNFIKTEIHAELHIKNQSVFILCSRHHINAPSFHRFIKIGKYDENREIFWIDPKKSIIEKVNIFFDQVEKEKNTIIYKISALLYERFNLFPIYSWRGWKV